MNHPTFRICRSGVVALCLPLLFALPVGCTKKSDNGPAAAVKSTPTAEPESESGEPTPAAPSQPSELAAPSNSATESQPSSTSEAVADDSQVGELKIRFQYGGQPPRQRDVTVNRDIEYCGKFPHVSEKLVVSADNKGIKNVIVYLYTGRGGSELPELPPSSQTITLANQNCRFEPHILLAQKGDTVRVTNEDEVGHNTNLSFINNPPQNATVPQGADQLFVLAESEPAPIPVECNIHPWMAAHLVVLDHPFVAVSDENGDLTISGLPAGKKLVFRAFHESGSIGQVTVEGKETDWRRSRFEVDVQGGVNDLGTVVIPADSFTAE